MSLNVLNELPKGKELGFGQFFAPKMLLSHYEKGVWSEPQILPVENLSLHPAAKVLHYAQEIFEGLKVYKAPGGRAHLFRPEKNILRMNRSAELMAMPTLPVEKTLLGLCQLSQLCTHLIPDEPGALYLRPTMIGLSTALGVAPASEFLYYVLASPVGGYFGSVKADEPAGISVLVTTDFVRAAPGGLGEAKTGANYAASLRPMQLVKEQKFHNVMFLDAVERRYIEELSGMNVFVVRDGKLLTPSLQRGTILHGVTRASILELAKQVGLSAMECDIDLPELMSAIGKHQNQIEVFACGTGASITAITELGFRGERIKVGDAKPGQVTHLLYKELLDIQYGRKAPKDSSWIVSL